MCPGSQDLSAEYGCELAALPLGAENAARRAKGVALIRSVLRAAATAAVAPAPAAEMPEWSAAAAAAAEGGAAGAAGAEGVVAKARKMLQRCRGILTTHEQVRCRNACAPTGERYSLSNAGTEVTPSDQCSSLVWPVHLTSFL